MSSECWDLCENEKQAEIIPIVNPAKYINNFCLYTPKDVLKQAKHDINRSQIQINSCTFHDGKTLTNYLHSLKIPLTMSTWILQLCTQAAFAFPLEIVQDRFKDSVVGHHRPKSKHYKPVRIRGTVDATSFSMQLVKRMRCFYVTDEGKDLTTHHLTVVIDVRGTSEALTDAWFTLHTQTM